MLAIAFGTLIPPPNNAHAGGYEPWLYMQCVEHDVNEGEDFRLVVRKKYKSHSPHETIRGSWYTDAITADEADYEHMDGWTQASNGYQSRVGKMGRDFHTLEDRLPELDETYRVRFINSSHNDDANDGECLITIKDDDGVGIYDLEIRSVPRELPSVEGVEGPLKAYTTGDTILVTAHFNHPVTTVNPDTGEQADYAGLYLGIGLNRRVAHIVRGDGTDELIFGYTVQSDDVDLNGIRVETGWDTIGLYYNEGTGDSGLWPVNPDDGPLNRIFFPLRDDPEHPVAQVEVDEPIITPPPPVEPPVNDDPTPPPETPLVEEPSIVEPIPAPWAERSIEIEGNRLTSISGELTLEDEGRDWYNFVATGGQGYIIELKNQMEYQVSEPGQHFGTPFVPGHLVDPSILEITNEPGDQVMGESDQGGFLGNFARAFFRPEADGLYYIAVRAGAGAQARGALGFYELSVRADDYADDYKTPTEVVLLPGESITARINSDVSPDDPDLNPWDWWGTESDEDYAQPLHGLESLDDLDYFRFVIEEEGTYEISVNDGPELVGVWATYHENGNLRFQEWDLPVQSVVDHFEPCAYMVEIGTPFQSVGNTGDYTVSLNQVEDTQ